MEEWNRKVIAKRLGVDRYTLSTMVEELCKIHGWNPKNF